VKNLLFGLVAMATIVTSVPADAQAWFDAGPVGVRVGAVQFNRPQGCLIQFETTRGASCSHDKHQFLLLFSGRHAWHQAGIDLLQEVEDPECALPMFGLRILEIMVDDLEGVRQGDAEPARDIGELCLGFVAVVEADRRPSGEVIEDRPQFDLFIEMLEFVNALLQAFGDRQVEGPYNVAAVCLGNRLAADEQIVDFLVYKVAVAFEVLLVDVEPGRDPKETFEPSRAHYMTWKPLARFQRRCHDR
jgi:hypothetical protein